MSKFKYKNKLEGALDDLLDILCIEKGMCIPPDHARKIMKSHSIDADTFAMKVLEAERLGDDSDFKYYIKQKFIKKFGNEVSIESYENSRA